MPSEEIQGAFFLFGFVLNGISFYSKHKPPTKCTFSLVYLKPKRMSFLTFCKVMIVFNMI